MSVDNSFEVQKSVFPFVKRLMGYSYGIQPMSFWILMYSVAVVGVIESLYPYVFRSFIDECIPVIKSTISGDLGSYFSINCVRNRAFVFIFMIVAMILHVLIFIYYAGLIAENTVFHLRKDIFYKMQYMSFDFIDRNSAGWLLTRLSSDTDRIMEVISWGLIGFGWGVVMIVFCFGVMFSIHFYLALMVLATIPLLVMATIYIRRNVMKFSRESRRLNSEMIGLVNEHIYGIEVNRILGAENRATEIYAQKAMENKIKSFKASFFSASYFPIVVGLGSIATFFVLNIGGQYVEDVNSALSIGGFTSFFVYSILVYEPIIDIASYYSTAQNSMSAGERIFSLLDQPISVKDKHDAIPDIPDIKGDIEFVNVRFGYQDSKLVIPNLNLHIAAGMSVALVGPTGEGKTTIGALIARFYEPLQGMIKIDGVDYREFSLKSYRQKVGVVMQSPSIFSGSLFSNIQFDDPNISRLDVRNILLEMQLDDWANNLDMPITADGANLSMGQKQLISLARAFAYRPQILILDEATSNLDLATEAKIQSAILKLIKGQTSIVIAHRLSTIERCDLILYIDRGQIVEQGTHQQLLAIKGRYYSLATSSNDYLG